MKNFWRTNSTWLIVFLVLLVLAVFGFSSMGQTSFVRTTLSGLTLGALYFMVASGLTLVFGLMDVLNFAHGTTFMVGAYMGWQFFTNPTFLFGIAPLILAFLAGINAGTPLQFWITRLDIPEKFQGWVKNGLSLVGILVGVLSVWGVDILGLAQTALVAITADANPLAEISAQIPLSEFWYRPFLALISGLLLAIAMAGPGDKTKIVSRETSWRIWITVGVLLVITFVSVLIRESAPQAVLLMNADLRFVLALLVGILTGVGLGAAMEITLIRPLYVRPMYQVLVTLGIAYVFKELIQLLWQPLAYQMSRPPLFSQPGKAENMLAWFQTHNTTVDIWGVTFPSYRLFIILLGVLMLIGLAILMKYTRFGMIIRAGVQDRQMVEALGINVRKVFTTVFALGAGLAALGGIGAAPFIPVQPNMGDAFQLQGFIVVVIGGMGSYGGAAIGAILLGMARAFGDYLALKFSLSPAISEASTVIIMAIVLIVRPSGLFGKKE
ncbi:MAG: branched-chain amino acid ABC transporter permease [Chloroflexi bacterium HGW-Chloroflexi-10]|nr:MAG: branched-chain amino acid ABC transporter permease [Chloroflexi bacterium HGW-Chloroflexi-10]